MNTIAAATNGCSINRAPPPNEVAAATATDVPLITHPSPIDVAATKNVYSREINFSIRE